MSSTLDCKRGVPCLETVAERIDQISSLPHIALKVIEVANDPNSGAMDLKDAMESDPALSARVLRCVNSSHYGLRNHITSLSQAIAYLGVKQIRNMAVTTSVSELFREGGEIGTYSRKLLWSHLVAVGVCSRLLAMRRGIGNFEDCFLAGLLHDIGIVLEDQHLHEPFVEVLLSLDEGKTLPENEKQKIGFTHAELAYRVAEGWRFPEPIAAAIRYHHNANEYHGPSKMLVCCVEVANILCTLTGISSVGTKLVRFNRASFEALSLQRNDVEVIVDDLERELHEHSKLFEI